MVIKFIFCINKDKNIFGIKNFEINYQNEIVLKINYNILNIIDREQNRDFSIKSNKTSNVKD